MSAPPTPLPPDHNLNLITAALQEKATLKQGIFRNTVEVFNRLKNLAAGVTDQLSERLSGQEKMLKIEFREVNDYEFHLRFSGDLLIFTMHSNIITFPEEHVLGLSRYMQEDPRRAFFGHIMVYNFMADSFTFNRLEDRGYLVSRLLVNIENHFFVEGVRQFTHAFPDVAQNQLTDVVLQNLVEIAMLVAIENDLVATPYQEIQVISLGQKLANQMVSTGQKVGFQMRSQSEPQT